MAVNNFGGMRTRILDELDRTDMTAQVETEVRAAIRHYEHHHFHFNEEVTTGVTATDVPTQSINTNIHSIHSVYLQRNGYYDDPLENITYLMYRNISGDDTAVGGSSPTKWAYYDEKLFLYPNPDASYTIVISALVGVDETSLSASTDTNAWLDEGRELIKERAKAGFLINYERDASARSEAQGIAMAGEDFLSVYERVAYGNLKRAYTNRVSSRIKQRWF